MRCLLGIFLYFLIYGSFTRQSARSPPWLSKAGSKFFVCSFSVGPTAAGGIARRLRLPQNILSFHIATLARSRLVASRKEGRSIIYFVDLQGTRDLLSFLVEDSVGGNAELCGPLVASAETGCCPA